MKKTLLTILFLLVAIVANATTTVVSLGPQYYPEPDRSRAISSGYIYVGEPNTDPVVPANQKTLSVLQQDGTIVAVSQPLRTGAGGLPVYNGSPVTMLVDGTYSLKILNSASSQQYYIPDSKDIAPTTFSDADFQIYNDSVNTKIMELDVSAISTGTTRTASMPDRDIVLGTVASDPTPSLGGDLDTDGNQIKTSKGADIASASTITLGTDGNTFDITGTNAISAISTSGVVGTMVRFQFDGVLTLTHNATDLILPTGANITTAAGDIAIFEEYASGDWRCVNYQRADGQPVAGTGLTNAYVRCVDKLAAGTQGGTFTSGAWRTRQLTDELDDTESIATLASDQIALPAGDYIVNAWSTAYAVDGHKIRIWDATNSAELLIGSSAYTPNLYGTNTLSHANGIITIPVGGASIEVQHRCVTTLSGRGYGRESNIGTEEIYTSIELWRLSE